jgi:hypothetical protein
MRRYIFATAQAVAETSVDSLGSEMKLEETFNLFLADRRKRICFVLVMQVYILSNLMFITLICSILYQGSIAKSPAA